MAKGYQIGVGVDTKAAKQAIDAGLVDPLEDAQKELTELGKNKGPEQLERGLRDAQKESKDLKKETERTADAIDKEYKRAYREAKENAQKGLDGAGEATKEFKQEALQNFSEVTSSFDGSMSSIQDLAQGTLGGLASSGLPGIGIAAGVAAAGVGLIGGAIEGIVEQSEATKEKVIENFREMAQSGIDEWSSAQAVIARMTDAYADHGDEIKAISDEIGVPAEIVAQAWAGVPESMELVNVKMAEARDKAVSLVSGDFMKGAEEMRFDRIVQPLNDAIAVIDSSQEKYREFAAWQDGYLRDVMESAGTASKEVDALGNILYTLADGTEIVVDVDTGLASQTVNEFKGDLDGIPETVDTKINVTHNANAAVAAMHRELANANLSMRIKLKDQYGRDL